MRSLPRLLLPLGLAALLTAAGCSKDKDVEPPATLVDFPQTLQVKKLWGEGVGGGKKQMVLRLGLGPAVDNGVVFAASHKGEVLATALETGHHVWLKNLKIPISAGPGVGAGLVVVGSSKGVVVALDGATGRELWRSRLNSELLSAPAISEKIVVLRSVDGRLHGLDAHDGRELWSVEQQVPRLSLRGTATPVIAKDVAISGFDNGKVMAVSLNSGDTVWDTALASPHGRTELDRLVDVDSAVRTVGDNVFATGFQGRTAMLAIDSGQIWWAHDMSSYRGLAVDDDNLYVTQSDGIIVALRQRDGSELWRTDKLKLRRLTTPVLTSTAVVVADFQGYLHWLDKSTGQLVARQRVAKKELISNAPVAAGDTVVVMTDRGKISAYRATPGAAVPRGASKVPGVGKAKKVKAAKAPKGSKAAPPATPPTDAAPPAAPATPAAPPAAPPAEPATPPAQSATPAPAPDCRSACNARAGCRAAARRSRDSSADTVGNVLPVVALIGRPNVGKSTLFNAMTGTRDALVADLPGLTRDRQYGFARRTEVPCIVVDTGGLVENADDIESLMIAQTERAISEADRLIVLVDGRAGVTPQDQFVAQLARRSGKPLFLAVNKTEGFDHDIAVADFHQLGLGEPHPIAAAHDQGVISLLEAALEGLTPDPQDGPEMTGIKVAVIGRPNVGKSTLINRLLGENRMVAFDQPGTTRDAVLVPFERDGERYTLIDTAGLRRRSRVEEAVEKFSVIKTLQAIETANVVVVVMDAHDNVAEQDASLLGTVIEQGRAIVLAVNKWDNIPTEQRDLIRQQVQQRLQFADFAPLHFISARHGSGVGELFAAVRKVYAAATRDMGTPELTRVLEAAIESHQPPLVSGRRIKLRYAHQGGRNPPVIVIHGNQTDHVPDAYRRYLVNVYRKAFDLMGTPVRVTFRGEENPFAGKRNPLTARQVRKRKRLIQRNKR